MTTQAPKKPSLLKTQLIVFNTAWIILWGVLAIGDLVALFFIPFRWWFLVATLTFGPCEGIGIFAKRADLPPLTDVIREYVPEWVALALIFGFWGAGFYLWNRPPSLVATFLMFGLLGWFVCHFITRYLSPKSFPSAQAVKTHRDFEGYIKRGGRT